MRRVHGLLAGVGPVVGVVEVEHQLEACLLDAPAEAGDVVEVLADALLTMLLGSILRLYEQTDAHGVPSLLL